MAENKDRDTDKDIDLEKEKDKEDKEEKNEGESESGKEEGEKPAEETEPHKGEDEEPAEESLSHEGKDGKSPKEKGKKWKKKKDEKDEKIEELSDKLLRQMAEFDNYRKRTEKEKSSMYIIGAKDIIEKLLPVIDNFERGLLAVPEDKKDDAFVTGMEMVYKQMTAMLESAGVKTIEAVGCQFNPDIHNAVMHIEDDKSGENMVVEEFQKGYTYHDIVIRHSMVKVAN